MIQSSIVVWRRNLERSTRRNDAPAGAILHICNKSFQALRKSHAALMWVSMRATRGQRERCCWSTMLKFSRFIVAVKQKGSRWKAAQWLNPKGGQNCERSKHQHFFFFFYNFAQRPSPRCRETSLTGCTRPLADSENIGSSWVHFVGCF